MITSWSFWAVLAGSVVVHWSQPRWRPWLLGCVSFAYLCTLDRLSVALVVAFSVAFYFASQRLDVRGRARWVGFALIAGVLLSLGYFKYFPGVVYQITDGKRGVPVADVVVPLGASYFTFKLVAYMFDAVRGTMPTHKLSRFLSYMLLFPIFTAGPIERFVPFLENEPKALDAQQLGQGLTRIIYGLVKKLVIVDVLLAHRRSQHFDFYLWTPLTVTEALDRLDTVSTVRLWQFAVNNFVSLYLDFSAYSDIAIGASLLFGYRIGENFNYPIVATNIAEFWKRWHMSLAGFCQRYVYMPVMAKTRDPYVAVIATMTAIGLWHAGSLNFVAWGLYHSLLMCGFMAWSRVKRRRGLRLSHRGFKILGWAGTMGAVVAGASFTSTNGLGVRAGLRIFARLFGVRWS